MRTRVRGVTPRRARSATVRLLAAGVLVVMVLPGCGGGDGGGGDTASASPLADLFGWSEYDPVESRRQDLAIEEAVVACMREEGFEYVPQDFAAQADLDAGQEDYALMQDSPEAYGEKYGYGIVRGYEIYEEPYIGEDGEMGGPTFEDPNEDYLATLSDSERDAYYEVLYGPPQMDEAIDDTDPLGTQVMYAPPLEEQGCQGRARLEVVGDDPMNDPEIQAAMNDVFEAQQNDPRLEDAERVWAKCMSDTLAEYDLPDGMTAERSESMYQVVTALKSAAMGQQVLPLDPDSGEPIGDFDDTAGWSSYQNEDGSGFAFVGNPTIIPDDELERLRADELALWGKDWDCQKKAGLKQLRIDVEQDAVDDLLARFPQLGDTG